MQISTGVHSPTAFQAITSSRGTRFDVADAVDDEGERDGDDT